MLASPFVVQVRGFVVANEVSGFVALVTEHMCRAIGQANGYVIWSH